MIRARNFFLTSFIVLTAFNVWHISKRGIWDPPRLMDSLLLGPAIVNQFHPIDPRLRTSIRGADDGQFAYAILYDPLLMHRQYLHLFDNPLYRYQRILYSWLVEILSVGQPRVFPFMMLVINITAYVGGAVLVGRLARREGWTRGTVVGTLLITGLVYSTFRSMTEPLALLLVVAGLLAESSERRVVAVGLFALSVLARETSATVPLALYSWKFWTNEISWKTALKIAAALLFPFILWSAYVHLRIPGFSAFEIPTWAPPSTGIGRFTAPFLGMWQEGSFGWYHLTTQTELKRTFSILGITVLYIVISWIGFWIRPTLWSWLAATQGLFLSIMRGDIWNYHASSARQVVVFFFLLIIWCADEMKFPQELNPRNKLPKLNS